MPRIRIYPEDLSLNGGELLFGSDSNGATVNIPLQTLSDFLVVEDNDLSVEVVDGDGFFTIQFFVNDVAQGEPTRVDLPDPVVINAVESTPTAEGGETIQFGHEDENNVFTPIGDPFTIQRGPKGEQGEPGPYTDITVGATSTGAPGTEATVTYSEPTQGERVLNFSIPRGEKGNTGIAGPQGAYYVKLFQWFDQGITPTAPTTLTWTPPPAGTSGPGTLTGTLEGWSLEVTTEPSPSYQLWEVMAFFIPAVNDTITVWSQPFHAGAEGPAGSPGERGESIRVASYNFAGNGTNVIMETAETATSAGQFFVQRGEQGIPGDHGNPGAQGPPGMDGMDGMDGTALSTNVMYENAVPGTVYNGTAATEGDIVVTFELVGGGDLDPILVHSGPQGIQGPPGLQGDPGDGITAVEQDPVAPQAGNPSTLTFKVGADTVGTAILPSGEKGATGDKGDPGQDGSPGQTGGPGIQGPPGTAATVDAGNATILTHGQQPTVTNTGDTTNAVFDFGIPAGQQGERGQQGEPGADSEVPGPKGDQGDQGFYTQLAYIDSDGNPGTVTASGTGLVVPTGGWSFTPPDNPVNEVWISTAVYNPATPNATLEWSAAYEATGGTGVQGPQGIPGPGVTAVFQNPENPGLGQSSTLTFSSRGDEVAGMVTLPAGQQGPQGAQGLYAVFIFGTAPATATISQPQGGSGIGPGGTPPTSTGGITWGFDAITNVPTGEVVWLSTGLYDPSVPNAEVRWTDAFIAAGETGPVGPQGPDGVGVPAGGNQGQTLVKTANGDYATGWVSFTTGYNSTHQQIGFNSVGSTITASVDLSGFTPLNPSTGGGSTTDHLYTNVIATVPVLADLDPQDPPMTDRGVAHHSQSVLLSEYDNAGAELQYVILAIPTTLLGTITKPTIQLNGTLNLNPESISILGTSTDWTGFWFGIREETTITITV